MYFMSEGNPGSIKSKSAQYLLQLLPPQLSASFLGQCAISFAPEQQLWGNIENENVSVLIYNSLHIFTVRTLPHWFNVVWTF